MDEKNYGGRLSRLKLSELYVFKFRRSTFDAVTLCSTKESVRLKNESELRKTSHPVVKILSKNNPNGMDSGPEDLIGGLSQELYLSVGTKIMLKPNFWVKGGLVNGSIGPIRTIVYADVANPPDLPLYI